MEKITYSYKIRDKESGLFSKGGSSPSWSKDGKIWTSLACLKLHLSMFATCMFFPDSGEIEHVYRVPKEYKNAEIVKLKVLVQIDTVETGKTVKEFVQEHDINHGKKIT